MKYENIIVEVKDRVATLTLNRPGQYNALSEELLDSLEQALTGIGADPTVRVVVLAAAGKAFCAGHDLGQMRARPELEYYQWLFARCTKVMMALQRMPQVVIARVHGIATAAGCQLVDFAPFPDHGQYDEATLKMLADRAKLYDAGLVTTEKDWVRLPPAWRARVTPWPVRARFDDPAAVAELLAKVGL